MLILLETPVGIAILNSDKTVVAKYVFTSPQMAYEVYEELENFNESKNNSILDFLKNNINNSIYVNSPKLLSLKNLVNFPVIFDKTIFKAFSNPFKHFGVNRRVFNVMTMALAQKRNGSVRNSANLIELLNYIDFLEGSINNRMMRIREWYSIHFPEMNVIEDNLEYLNNLIKIGFRGDACTNDSDNNLISQELINSSIGSDLQKSDILPIIQDAKDLISSINHKEEMQGLLKEYCREIIPNLEFFVGSTVAVKLIRKAGSLARLTKMASSTIQILGSEKAFMNVRKSGGYNTPKYGFIYSCFSSESRFFSKRANKEENIDKTNHKNIDKTNEKNNDKNNDKTIDDVINKGKMARILSNKIALCAKVDLSQEYSDGSIGRKYFDEIIQKSFNHGKKRMLSVVGYNKRLKK